MKDSQPHTMLLALVTLTCFKLLHIMHTTNQEILNSRPTFFFFVSQKVYLEIPPTLIHDEDCATKHFIPMYRFKLARHIADTCEAKQPKSAIMNQYETLPEISLNNMVIDKQRNYLYTAVLGAFGTKWSTLMAGVNKVDGEYSDNLVKMAKFVQTSEGKEFLNKSTNLFKFYFVRNPLDRVISGYYYYFVDLSYAMTYLNGVAFKELIRINKLNPGKVTQITFEQYLKWVISGESALKHFGVQSDLIQPCAVKYSLNGIFEILTMERLVIANNVLDLKTPRSIFTTVRDLTYLTTEARNLVKSVDPAVMEEFYEKYKSDYETWNYSRPHHWFYPYPAFAKHMRLPLNPTFQGNANDWTKVKDLKEEDLVMLEELKGEEKREVVELQDRGSFGVVPKLSCSLVLVILLFY